MIERQAVTVKCDFCPAFYRVKKPMLKAGWREVTVDGEDGLVACPREIIEQTIIDLTPQQAYDWFYNEAHSMAAKEGSAVE